MSQPSKGLCALLFGLGLGLSVPATAADPPADSLRVLFIGNSLTYFNDLPAMLAALAKAGGLPPLSWEGILVPGASLEDQWRSGEARRAIARGKWNVVVGRGEPKVREALALDPQFFAASVSDSRRSRSRAGRSRSFPLRTTARIRRVLRMSARGSASRSTRSARLPAATEP